MRRVLIVLAASLCAGCVTTEQVSFVPKADQKAIVRDGNPAIVSTKKNSIVIVRPASRQFQIGSRPVFVVAMYNRTGTPQDFRTGQVQAVEVVNDETVPIKVISYEQLVQEEKNRQVVAAIAVGLAAGANAYSASRAGYYNSTSTLYTPRGTYQVNTVGYSPTAAAIAQTNASFQNDAMISNTIEQGQRNLSVLERSAIKDNTLLPGEWYGGQLHLGVLASDKSTKRYSITVYIGSDRHEIAVSQGPQANS